MACAMGAEYNVEDSTHKIRFSCFQFQVMIWESLARQHTLKNTLTPPPSKDIKQLGKCNGALHKRIINARLTTTLGLILKW